MSPRSASRASQDLDLQTDDALDLGLRKPAEHDDLVDAVEELGLEVRVHRRHHLFGSSAPAPRFDVMMMIVFVKSTVRP